MDTHSERFEELRPRLWGIVFRSLGNERETQAILDEARLRWTDYVRAGLDPDAALMIMITIRLVIEHRRARPVQSNPPRRWDLVAPHAAAQPALDRADDIAVMLFTLLEGMEPQARAAFLLRGAFAAEYPEIAGLIGRSEVDCQALVSEVKSQLLAELIR
jgi:RNA polymerase sigma-70 factor (ECF subfamily)